MSDPAPSSNPYEHPDVGARLREIVEAIYERRGAFSIFPLSRFEEFQKRTCEARGLDFQAERRRAFEFSTALQRTLITRTPTISDDDYPVDWPRTYWRSLGAWDPLHTQNKPLLRDVRALFKQLGDDGTLPTGATVQVDRSSYSWQVDRSEGDWTYTFQVHGRSRAGVAWSANPLVTLLRLSPRHFFMGRFILDAFLDFGGHPPTSVAEFTDWHRREAQKISAVLAYMDATAPSGLAPTQ